MSLGAIGTPFSLHVGTREQAVGETRILLTNGIRHCRALSLIAAANRRFDRTLAEEGGMPSTRHRDAFSLIRRDIPSRSLEAFL